MENTTLSEEFIPYEQSLALKELGFDEPCFVYIYTGDTGNNIDHIIETKPSLAKNYNLDLLCISKPLYQQAFSFFREKHNWQSQIEATKDQYSFKLGYNFYLWNNITGEEINTEPKGRPSGDWIFESYQESQLECIKTLIEICRNAKKE
jgi:hypothetical protein